MVQYTWDKGTNKYISAEGQIMGGGTAYKTADGKWSLTKPTEQKTTTTTVKQASNGMNSVSQDSLDVNRNNAKAGTGYVAPIPEKSTLTAQDDMAKSIAEKWNGLDYETQQKKLKTVAGMKEYLDSKGIVSKTAPEQPTTTTQTTTPTKTTTKATPQQQQWDYQDNSQARKDQILNNLNNYRGTNPELFEDASMFYNFFIDGNGRSQEQIDLLWDYFNKNKEFGKYDNLPASTIGDMLVGGKLGDDYLNHLKATDPQKYQEALSYKQKGEDDIRYESFLSDAADQAGLGSQFEKFYKGIFGYRDENDDKIDDSLYIAPTEEEQTKQNRVNTIDSRIMEIKNMQKNLLDDLADQYPGVPMATLMGIVQDRTKDLQREYDDLMVERTGLVGNIEYMQNERDMQMDARQNTINNLKTAYGMYYDYTAEGIAEMAQNKYAATNITLDQADQGTETEKRMALDSALSGYYEKYGSIIQRPKEQVISDVIEYASKNGVTLAQALQENFVSQLQKKPEYAQMNTDTSNISWGVIGEDADGHKVYGFIDTLNKTVDPYGSFGGKTGGSGYEYTVDGINKDRDERVSYMSDLASNYTTIGDMANAIANGMSGLGGGELDCGKYVNDYINAVTGVKGDYGNSIASKTALAKNKNWGDIQVGDAIVFDYNINTPQWVLNSDQKDDLLKYGHVGIVTGVNDDGSITMSHTNGGVVTETTVKPGSSFYGSFAGSQHIQPSKSKSAGYNEQWSNEYVAFLNAADNPESQKKIANGLGLSVDEMREQSNRYSWAQTADSYYDVLDKINWLLDEIDAGTLPSFYERGNALSDSWLGGITSGVNQNVADWYDANDRIVSVLGLDSLINLKGRGATFGALSDSERQAINTYATSLGKNKSEEKYKQELIRLRNTLIESSHGYLGDLSKYGQNQSYDWSAGIS